MGLALAVGYGQRSKASENPVHTIALPHDEPLLPPGPGREEFVAACVVCHSPRYITLQPPFTRSTWLGEVNKMKDVYGAHISDQQVPPIVDYLVSINGMADRAGTPTTAGYGE
jgi:mono/diheme cytochrome c family protein